MNKTYMKRKIGIICILAIILTLIPVGTAVYAEDNITQNTSAAEENDFSDFDGLIIGVMTGSIQERYVSEQIPRAEMAYFNNNADMVIALQQNKVDAIALPLLMVHPMLKDNPDLVCDDRILGSDKVCYAFPKNDQGDALRDEFNDYLTTFRESGELEKYTEIYYENQTESYSQHNFDMLEGPNGTIRYGTSTQMPPFAFMTGEGFTGIDAEILYGFCTAKGYRLEMEDTAFPSVLAGLSTGIYDMGGGGIAYTEERAENAYFSDAYFDSLQVLVEIRGSGVGTSGSDDNRDGSFGFLSSLKRGFENTFIKEGRWKLLLKGLANTLIVTAVAFVLGTILAIGITGMMLSKRRTLRKAAQFYHYLMQGLPMVIILMLLYYVIFSTGRINPIIIAAIGFGLSAGSGIAESLYGAINGVQRGEQEASLALGFTERQTFWGITLPQAIPKALPGYRGQIVGLLKGTSIVGYIAIEDLTKMADIIRSRSFEAFFPIITTAVAYFAMVFLIRFIFAQILKRMDHTGKRRHVKGVNES